MKIAALSSLALLALPMTLAAQSQSEIDRALFAAPASMRADAEVISLRPDGSIVTLKAGSNNLICWDNTVRAGDHSAVDSQCTVDANRERLAQNHQFEAAGGGEEAIRARFDRAEEDGSRATSEFGSIYYHVRGDSPTTISTHTTVAVPFATNESLGLPGERGPGRLWLMQPGTTAAHLMVAGM